MMIVCSQYKSRHSTSIHAQYTYYKNLDLTRGHMIVEFKNTWDIFKIVFYRRYDRPLISVYRHHRLLVVQQ